MRQGLQLLKKPKVGGGQVININLVGNIYDDEYYLKPGYQSLQLMCKHRYINVNNSNIEVISKRVWLIVKVTGDNPSVSWIDYTDDFGLNARIEYTDCRPLGEEDGLTGLDYLLDAQYNWVGPYRDKVNLYVMRNVIGYAEHVPVYIPGLLVSDVSAKNTRLLVFDDEYLRPMVNANYYNFGTHMYGCATGGSERFGYMPDNNNSYVNCLIDTVYFED